MYLLVPSACSEARPVFLGASSHPAWIAWCLILSSAPQEQRMAASGARCPARAGTLGSAEGEAGNPSPPGRV